MERTNRHEMPTQPAKERILNFNEVALGFTPEIAKAEAERCLNCKNSPCMTGCPVGVRIPDFIARVKAGDMQGAVKILNTDNNLSAICGRVCPQESQCEKYCVRKVNLGGSVAIGSLERYVADYALANGLESLMEDNSEAQNAPKYADRKVAVIGTGPASLSCASDLARAGVKVVMFEALHKAGGVLVYGIPEFRLPKALVGKMVDNVKALGVDVQTDVVIGKTLYIDELLFEYDAVFIGTGAGLPSFMRIKGENLNGVYSANEYLTRVNLMKAYKNDAITPIMHGKNVVVVGAGNVAMDAARTALRLGANVNLVYRRSRVEMPAREEEINHAEEEGVVFNILQNPVEILGDENGSVRGIRLIKMELGEPDASGRRSPIPIEGSEYEIECDEVIVALGTTPNPLIKNSMPSLETSKKGTIVADECGRTSVKRVYVGGDAMTGAATVILAMGAGKKAAQAILDDFD
ncbi:MAG: NADPH-dependent glutamate synthase [Clostridia bacterium]|nr:NADPH-dependent glutamate synthase [Clostridia bacterium]